LVRPESRDELLDIWAALLAAAADPKKSRSFRLKFIEIVKLMDALDAAVLAAGAKNTGAVAFDRNKLEVLAAALHCRTDEVAISLENLERFGLAHRLAPEGGNECDVFKPYAAWARIAQGRSCQMNREQTLSHSKLRWDD